MRFMLRSMLMFVSLMFAVTVFAQDPPAEFDVALSALSEEVGTAITIADLSNWSWEEFQFGDSSLGCAEEGMAYAQVITRGYQINLVYQGMIYDYRIATGSDMAMLCSTSETETTENPNSTSSNNTPVPPPIQSLPETTQVISTQNTTGAVAVAESILTKAVVWSPDNTIMAVADANSPSVWLYNAADLTEDPQLITVENAASALAFSPDSTLLVIGDDTGILYFLDVADSSFINQFEAHTVAIATVSFSPDGRYLVSVGSDNFARFFAVQR